MTGLLVIWYVILVACSLNAYHMKGNRNSNGNHLPPPNPALMACSHGVKLVRVEGHPDPLLLKLPRAKKLFMLYKRQGTLYMANSK